MQTQKTPQTLTQTLRAFLELARPANVVTAFADILAGFAAAGALSGLLFGREYAMPWLLAPTAGLYELAWLLAATAGLYAGGVVFNDVFDAALDADERPERPIPSGRTTRAHAALFGSILLAGGLTAAACVGATSFFIAAAIACCALGYDAAAKRHAVAGPLAMGLCRGGNLLLGVSAVPHALESLWFLALIPIAYVGGIVVVSRGEVHGGSGRAALFALAVTGGVCAALLALGFRADYRTLDALPFLGFFIFLVAPALRRAAAAPSPEHVRRAVQASVLALTPLGATLAAGFASWIGGLLVLALLPLSMLIARRFAVT